MSTKDLGISTNPNVLGFPIYSMISKKKKVAGKLLIKNNDNFRDMVT